MVSTKENSFRKKKPSPLKVNRNDSYWKKRSLLKEMLSSKKEGFPLNRTAPTETNYYPQKEWFALEEIIHAKKNGCHWRQLLSLENNDYHQKEQFPPKRVISTKINNSTKSNDFHQKE